MGRARGRSTASTDKIDELIRTLERAADATTTELAERISLLVPHRALCGRTRRARPTARRARTRRCSTLDAKNLEAAEALSPIYEQAGDAKKLASVYEVRLKHMEDPEARVVLLRETGLLYEEKLRNPQLAFERFLEAFVARSQQDVLREDLERLAGKVNGWDKVFAAYDTAIEAATHPDDANDLRLFYGQALAAQGRPRKPSRSSARSTTTAPTIRRRSLRSRSCIARPDDFQSLLDVLSRRAELESDVAGAQAAGVRHRAAVA